MHRIPIEFLTKYRIENLKPTIIKGGVMQVLTLQSLIYVQEMSPIDSENMPEYPTVGSNGNEDLDTYDSLQNEINMTRISSCFSNIDLNFEQVIYPEGS